MGSVDWVVRMRSGTLSNGERAEMQHWMAERPENARDLLRAEAAWRLSGTLENDAEVQRELRELDSRAPGFGFRQSAWQSARPAYAIVAAVFVLGIGVAIWHALAPRGYQTARGEQRVITLSDGSVIALNTDTRLAVDLTSKSRDIFLQRGEALFQVARDTQRPFIVHASRGAVRAVGTRFNVLSQDNAVTVSVLEGRVEVAPAVQAQTYKVLSSGQSAAYAADGKLITPEPMQASAERIVAWRAGKLRFESWRLDRAVREYNRYAEKPIRLESPDAAGVEISGVFRIGDSAAFVQALGELVNARVVDEGDALLLKSATTN